MVVVSLVTLLVVGGVVFLHNEFLALTARLLARFRPRRRPRAVFLVLASILAHTLEIVLFAVTYWLLALDQRWGSLEGNDEGRFLDCLYFSFTTYTTLGFGDSEPFGPLRFLTGVEALTGLVMITWTASFLYVEMRRERAAPE